MEAFSASSLFARSCETWGQGTNATCSGPARVSITRGTWPSRWNQPVSPTVTLGTSRVRKISRAWARDSALGRSWFPTRRKVAMPASLRRRMRVANSRWCVWLGSRAL